MGAVCYDALLLLAVLFFATAVALPFNGGQAFAPDQYVFPVYLLIVGFLFYAWFWTHGGQTLGMRAWRIRLCTLDGGPISWRQAVVRFAAACLSWACLGLGFIWCLKDRERRCWHDRLSATQLIYLGGENSGAPK